MFKVQVQLLLNFNHSCEINFINLYLLKVNNIPIQPNIESERLIAKNFTS